MEPRFSGGDKLFVSKLMYRLRKPRVGEVVVLRNPRDERLLLKRITEIRGGLLFVSGDNTDASTDSREFGAVGREQVVGKTLFRYARRAYE